MNAGQRILILRACALYLPIAFAAIAFMLRRPHRRQFAASLVSLCSTAASLLALQFLNIHFGWWSFHATGGLFCGMPVDLFLGWAILWGVLPTALFRRLNTAVVVAIFTTADLLLMPACSPLLELHLPWLIGEAIAVLIVLLPAVAFARFTLHNTHLCARAVMQVITSAGLFLLAFPQLVFDLRGGDWTRLIGQPSWLRGIELQLIFLLALPSLSAVQEFVQRGLGTPIPFDPPQRLVTTGIYRYIANPMQLSAALVLLCWGLMLRNLFVALASIGTLAYYFGVAAWDEHEDLDRRFGEASRRYRREVRDWLPRWRPYVDPATPRPRLYIAETCGICSEVRRWIERRAPIGLDFVAAEDHPTHALTRLTYIPMDGSAFEQGTRAFARALEHINLGWALVGALVRLPLLADLIQLLADAAGMGPKQVVRPTCSTHHRAA